MKLRIACKHCGVERSWERGGDGVVRPEKSTGQYGVGHYDFQCSSDAAPRGACEPREIATSMSVDAARAIRKRFVRG